MRYTDQDLEDAMIFGNIRSTLTRIGVPQQGVVSTPSAAFGCYLGLTMAGYRHPVAIMLSLSIVSMAQRKLQRPSIEMVDGGAAFSVDRTHDHFDEFAAYIDKYSPKTLSRDLVGAWVVFREKGRGR